MKLNIALQIIPTFLFSHQFSWIVRWPIRCWRERDKLLATLVIKDWIIPLNLGKCCWIVCFWSMRWLTVLLVTCDEMVWDLLRCMVWRWWRSHKKTWDWAGGVRVEDAKISTGRDQDGQNDKWVHQTDRGSGNARGLWIHWGKDMEMELPGRSQRGRPEKGLMDVVEKDMPRAGVRGCRG